jgi:probable selenium-dependent hydroxylase accessory protein YqeC
VDFSFVDPWHLFLPREGGHVISVMGSGGKTSLLKAFAAVYRQEGFPVILTTTTRTEPLAGVPAHDLEELPRLADGNLPGVFFLRDGQTSEGKWRGLQPEAVDRLGRDFPDHVVLVEVDGAAKLPLKLHRPGEPVWPGRTSLAVVVMGAGAVGGFVQGNVHRLGVIPSPVLDGLPDGAVLEWDHCLGLLTGPGGYLDQVPPEVPVLLVLANMAEVADSVGLFDFVGRAMGHPRLPLTLLCETEGEQPSFRTGCRHEEGAGSVNPEPGDE